MSFFMTAGEDKGEERPEEAELSPRLHGQKMRPLCLAELRVQLLCPDQR